MRKKGAGVCACGRRCRNKGRRDRRVLTAAGPIPLSRAYARCPACGLGHFPADADLGIDGLLSRQARRLLTAAGARQSFEQAEVLVRELCGFRVSHETIRQACLREGERVAAWTQAEPAACQPFRAAAGVVELQTDAAKVNTDTGWRDVKIAVFAKRPLGEAATPAEWTTRELPGPAARVALCAIETSEVFGGRWREWAARLGITDPRKVSVLGDGAEWIWEETRRHFPGARQVLDVYHALEHVAAAGRAVYGEGERFTAWLEEARRKVVGDGWHGACEVAAGLLAERNGAAGQEAVDGMVGYFAKHTARMNYCLRLRQGRSIGSGMVEGACKTAIGKRLKQTGARWNVGNVAPMGALCCLLYNDAWSLYWNAA